MKLDTNKFALTGGIVWGLSLFITTIVSVYIYPGYALAFLNGIGSIYPGYTVSLTGSIIGAVYGFFDVFIGTYIVVWIYKKLGK